MIDNEDIQSILTEQPEITPDDMLVELDKLTTTKHRMISPDMIVSFLTKTDSVSSLMNSEDEKAKGFLLAITSGGVSEFNLMDTHPVGQMQQMLLTHMVSVGAVTESFKTECLGYANYVGKKYTGLTLNLVRKAMNPSTFTDVSITAGSSRIVVGESEVLASGSNTGSFRFMIKTNADFKDAIRVRLFASKDGTNYTRFPQYEFDIIQQFIGGEYVSFIQKRASGLAGFKYFKFEFLEPWAGAVDLVEVEGVN